MSEVEREEANFDNYKHLAQFYNIVKRNQYLDDRCIDRDKVLWQLDKIMKQSSEVSYQFPNRDFVTLRNSELAGCTALHLAVCQYTDGVTRASVDALLKRRIDFTLKNHKGSTALHIAVDRRIRNYYCYRTTGRFDSAVVDMILSAHVEFDVCENPCDQDGISHFHVACMANHSSAVELFLNGGVSVDQVVEGGDSIFLGYTPLHFAVRYGSLEVAEILIRNRADVTIKDANGMSPIDLLLEQNMAIVDLINGLDNENSSWYYRVEQLMLNMKIYQKIMEMLLDYTESLGHPLKLNSTGLSGFHISCTLDSTALQEQLLSQVEDIDHCVEMTSKFWPGYTALHFAAHSNIKTLKFLLQHGANIEAKNAKGLTPFDICVERYKIEDLCFILEHHSAWKDILLTDNKTKLLDVVGAMKDSNTLDEFLKNVKSNQELLLYVPSDSTLWPGYTMLHLAVNLSERSKIISDCERKTYYTREDFEELESEYIKRIEICLKHGADVSVRDARGCTALDLAHQLQLEKVAKLLYRVVNSEAAEKWSHSYSATDFDYPRAAEKFITNYSLDVTNVRIKSTIPFYNSLSDSLSGFRYYSADENISEFQGACLRCDLETMEKLLKNGANVNESVNLLSDKCPGCTPLHLVLDRYTQIDNDRRIQAIDLLVSYGIDVNARDLFDNTAFHAVIKYNLPRISMFHKIFSIGTGIRLKNVFGIEPFGKLLKSRRLELEEIEFFLKHGCHLHIYEPMLDEGYLAECLQGGGFRYNYNDVFKSVMKCPDITNVDEFGRNSIHNIASRRYFTRGLDYRRIINVLLKRGCDIDRRDKFGRTPLQVAVDFPNQKLVTRLLTEGADINISNAKGCSAFAEVFEISKSLECQEYEYQYKAIIDFMSMHVRKLQIAGLYVSEENVKILGEVMKKWPLDEAKIERALKDSKKMKDLRIHSTSLSPYDFFSETGALAAFPYMSFSEQEAIISFFKSLRTHHFKQLGYLLNIQYKKMLKRVSLMKPVTVSLNRLVRLTLPENCSRCILRFLTNADLKSVIASVN